jgi:hypothetical protein
MGGNNSGALLLTVIGLTRNRRGPYNRLFTIMAGFCTLRWTMGGCKVKRGTVSASPRALPVSDGRDFCHWVMPLEPGHPEETARLRRICNGRVTPGHEKGKKRPRSACPILARRAWPMTKHAASGVRGGNPLAGLPALLSEQREVGLLFGNPAKRSAAAPRPCRNSRCRG